MTISGDSVKRPESTGMKVYVPSMATRLPGNKANFFGQASRCSECVGGPSETRRHVHGVLVVCEPDDYNKMATIRLDWILTWISTTLGRKQLAGNSGDLTS